MDEKYLHTSLIYIVNQCLTEEKQQKSVNKSGLASIAHVSIGEILRFML
jgi:hypothetical protein